VITKIFAFFLIVSVLLIQIADKIYWCDAFKILHMERQLFSLYLWFSYQAVI